MENKASRMRFTQQLLSSIFDVPMPRIQTITTPLQHAHQRWLFTFQRVQLAFILVIFEFPSESPVFAVVQCCRRRLRYFFAVSIDQRVHRTYAQRIVYRKPAPIVYNHDITLQLGNTLEYVLIMFAST